MNEACRGKVRPRDDSHQLLGPSCRTIDQVDHSRDDFTQVVRRNVGRHANRYAAGTVYQQVGYSGRQHSGLAERLIVVRHPVHRVFVDVPAQHLFGRLGEPHFRVAHRRRAVAIYRAEVALTVD